MFDDPNIRAEFIKVIDADSNLTDAQKAEIKREMLTYPVDVTAPDAEEKKEGFWQRLWNKLFGSEEEEQPAATGRLNKSDRTATR